MSCSKVFPKSCRWLLILVVSLLPTPAWSATPVSSSISLESFARYCDPGDCDGAVVIADTSIDSDVQLATLDPLLATINASAGNQLAGPGATASLSMNASFQSVSSGSIGFSGETGILRADISMVGGCAAFNTASQGFVYTFVASTDGDLTVDYQMTCSPVLGTFAGGDLDLYFDGDFAGRVSVTNSNPSASTTTVRPIELGETHTFRLEPNLAGVGGNGCGAPPGTLWTCSGSAAWSFDTADPVPSPGGSWTGSLAVLAMLSAAGIFALRPNRQG